MILFTARGALSSAFAAAYPCKIVSARSLSNYELETVIATAKTIIHNAAALQEESLSSMVSSNFLLTKRILDIAYKVNPGIKFINISSMSFLENCNTNMETIQMTNYAFSKYLAEEYCLKHSIKNLVSVRFSTIFYADADRDGLSKIGADALKNKKITLFNNGVALRDFIPLTAAVAYLFKLAQKEIFCRKINIASGKPLSFAHFVDIILNKNPEINIENIVTETKNVLYSFNVEMMNVLGKIEFDIDEEFNNYLFNFNENISL